MHSGEHTVFVSRSALESYWGWDYVVCLHKGGWGESSAWVWLVGLRERLPRVIVPLLEGDPDVVVDLQAVLGEVFGREGGEGGWIFRPVLPHARIFLKPA